MPQLKTASEKLLNGTPFLLPASKNDTKAVLSREDTRKLLSREDTQKVLSREVRKRERENKYDFSTVFCLACAFQHWGSLAGNGEAGLAAIAFCWMLACKCIAQGQQ